MAVVYLAHDRRHSRPVAIKVFPGGIGPRLGAERFLREIALAAGLIHPHIVPVYDSGDAEGVLYYVMPYIRGESLRERLSRDHRLPLAEAVRLAREVADALDYAHRHGVVHRDIKPENILLEEGHALVTDFGIARVLSADGASSLTRTGSAVGTPLYMSPEQADGEPDLDGRADIYSLGCVLFEALSGLPPFSGRTAHAILVRRLTESAPLLRTIDPTIPAAIEAAVARALALKPADRFATAAGLAAALAEGERSDAALTPSGHPLVSGNQRVGETSVAVLPFLNLSPDPDNEYFSDGVTEELINALAKVPGLRVASRTSSFALKGKEQDIRAIGERLRVRTIVEGSVRKAGNRIRIAVQLIDATDGYHLWSESYDRELADVFAVQNEIARTVVETLTPRLATAATAPLVDPGTENVEAYSLHLRGMHYSWKRSPETYRIALQYFEQAIKADPRFARPYASVAFAYTMLGFDEFAAMPPREAMPRAKAAIEKALERDPLLGYGHCRRAIISFLFDWDWPRAEQEFGQAVRLSPQDLATLHWHSMFLGAMGRHAESLAIVSRALTLDPLSVTMNVRLGHAHYLAGRFDAAARQLRATVEMEPGSVENSVMLARVYLRQQLPAEASALLEETIRRAGRAPILLGFLGRAYGASGRRREALDILAELRAMSAERYIPPLYHALVLETAGQQEEAFDLWNRAWEERSGWLAYIRTEPTWDAARSHPKFLALLQRMRLDF